MDRFLLFAQICLGALGIVGIAVASPELWDEQTLRVIVALAMTIIVARIPVDVVMKLSPFAYIVLLFLLVLVLFIGVSPENSDSQRWLPIGPVTFQPSEMMKVAVIAYLTAFFYNHMGNWQIWRPMLVIGLAAGLIVLEPDFSTAAFLFILAFAIMLAAGTTLFRLLSISLAAAVIAVVLVSGYVDDTSYVTKRFNSWKELVINGSDTATNDPNLSFQAQRAMAALQEAGFFGLGTSGGVGVPEADTDMIAIAIAQALGFVGIFILFAMYFTIAGRGLKIASVLEGPGSLLAAGATIYICGQASLNLLVASGLFPITGVPLPFVSYGLNSLLSVGIAMGFIHAAYRQARAQGVII